MTARRRLEVEFARLEGTVAQLVAEVQSYRAAADARSADHETRLRGLEHWRWSIPVSAVGLIVSAVVNWFHH